MKKQNYHEAELGKVPDSVKNIEFKGEDKWIEHVVIKLRSEGLNRLSYTTEKAISFLQDCVAGQRLIGTLIRNESKVISMLPGEVMQQKLF